MGCFSPLLGLSGLSRFMLSAQAPGAQVESFGLAIYNDSNRVNVGHPATIGMALGVAHIMTELR